MMTKNKPVFLTERREIAEAMNFGKYPVLSMEIGKTPAGWDELTVYEGCKVKIKFSRREDLYNVCTLNMYGDEQSDAVKTSPQAWDKLHLSQGPTVLHASFGYEDVQEMLENANAPWVAPGQEVIVVFNDSVKRTCWIRKMVVSDHVDDFGATVTTLCNPAEE